MQRTAEAAHQATRRRISQMLQQAYADLKPGTMFKSKDDVLRALAAVAVFHGCNHYVYASDTFAIRVICGNEKRRQDALNMNASDPSPLGCLYCCTSTIQPCGRFRVNQLGIHTCRNSNRTVTSQALARVDQAILGTGLQMVQVARERYLLNMTPGQMYRYRQLLQCDAERMALEYASLRKTVNAINRDGHHAARVDVVDGRFDYLVFCLKPNTISQNSPRVLFTDATFLPPPYRLKLLLLCQMDADNRAVILSAAIAYEETKEAYTQLFNFTIGHMGHLNDTYTVFSDEGPGVVAAIEDVHPWRPMLCTFHIRKNIVHQDLFTKVVEARTHVQFDTAMAEYFRVNRAEAQRIMRKGRHKWCQLFAVAPTFGWHTSNLVESINAALKKHKKFGPVSIMVAITHWMARRRLDVLAHAETHSSPLTSFAAEEVAASWGAAAGLAALDIGHGRVHVHRPNVQPHQPTVTVANGVCKNYSGLPCKHIVAINHPRAHTIHDMFKQAVYVQAWHDFGLHVPLEASSSYSPGDRRRTDWSDNHATARVIAGAGVEAGVEAGDVVKVVVGVVDEVEGERVPIPTSTACTCTRASSATASDACHDAELVNDTGHHKHIDAAATTNDWSGMADVNGSIVCSNGNNGSNNGNSCDGS
ncbi:hypothetical protein PTSG_06478 [Salpingoeca rosetta]|uniref:MULE transposase domain-containing protein n=1 Tax=Salpingoeca rosetta (strain ATCC 50818 / BSB-021) TaxID=946362 RepID=F2UFX5_SALR5|nr:uncharacterized protein PTSG_06478 [Salpingoeca rosetta]EGD75403.1 hypothetical protein PTSG_06478 [Salpingoeca rosetta]|eukprot:XP_004991860.1 hypothetical protein PTSG_06478 [Salpingoeca rosetta]